MASLEQTCFSQPWTFEQCLGALAQKAFAAYGLWRGGDLLAYVSFYHHPDELEILNLAVIPAERRKGHGRRILAILLQAANKMGMQKAVLEVRESNFAAIALYESQGFRKQGTRAAYYTDSGEDALIYCLDL